MSPIFRPFLSTVLLGSFALMLQVHGQGQSGFISIDCGLLGISSYNEAKTGITFTSDMDFIDVDESKIFSANNTNYQPYSSVRSFPNGMRSCYKLTVKSGTKYLIRASFFHGNYDGQDKLPQFQLHLGPNLWDWVSFNSTLDATIKELIHVALRDYIHVCLVNTGSGIPFISAIELRPLPNAIYNQSKSESLALISRYNTGQMAPNPTTYRYPNDIHDRVWYPYSGNGWTGVSTSSNVDSGSNNGYQLPSDVMRTAATPTDTDSLNLSWSSPDNNAEFHVYMHFAEVEILQHNQSRQLNITQNQIPMPPWQAFSPRYLNTNTVFSGGDYTTYSISKARDSNLSPIINAFEVYMVQRFLVAETNQEDFDAITNIKSTYKIQKNWQGDPCAPPAYLWQGVKCSYNKNNFPRIISLNLSGSGLAGQIAPAISNLTMIQTLDMSNNNLTGLIPDFLSQMPNLRILNLDRNNLTGLVPIQLIEKRNNGSLSLSLSGNPNLSAKVNPKSKNNNWVMPVLLSLTGISISLLVVAAICWLCGKSRGTCGPARGRIFTKSEIKKITSNLTSVIGQGGFGTVYRGILENKNEVAVKILSSSSRQGQTEFQNEVELLMRVHHKNLVTLVGYCDEVGMMALVYEYVASGNLQQHILTNDVIINVLTWKERLQIAMDAARGLDYLHTCCKPPIIHRDLKTTNILLNEKLQAKVADFGLSKVLASESISHVSTDPKGTPGYLDPEYYITMQLNKKSDVYSFGIVLLELITGKPAVIKRSSGVQHESYMTISEWVGTKLGTENDDIESIVDTRIQGMYAYSSMQKAIEIAIECVRQTAIQRPEINCVYDELKECLEIEIFCEKLQFRERNGRLGRTIGMTSHFSSDRHSI